MLNFASPVCLLLFASMLLPLPVSSTAQSAHDNLVQPLEALNPYHSQPINISLSEGSPLHLECFSTSELQSLPTVKIRWVRGKKKKFFYFVHARSVSKSSEPLLSPIQQSLHIRATALQDSGWWACLGNIYDVTRPTHKTPNNHFFIKWFHVRVLKTHKIPISANNSNNNTDQYGFKNATAAQFGGLKYLFSIGSLLFNFSLVAFCIAICGCLCCGGCLCF